LASEIGFERRGPESGGSVDAMAGQTLRRDIVMELARAAGGLKGSKVHATVTQRVDGVLVAVEPDRRPREGASATKQVLIDLIDRPARAACPSSGEVDDRLRDAWPPSAPGDRKDAAARQATDGNPLTVDKRLRQDGRSDRVDIAQGAVGAGHR